MTDHNRSAVQDDAQVLPAELAAQIMHELLLASKKIAGYCLSQNMTFRIPMATGNLSDTARIKLARAQSKTPQV